MHIIEMMSLSGKYFNMHVLSTWLLLVSRCFINSVFVFVKHVHMHVLFLYLYLFPHEFISLCFQKHLLSIWHLSPSHAVVFTLFLNCICFCICKYFHMHVVLSIWHLGSHAVVPTQSDATQMRAVPTIKLSSEPQGSL